MLQHVADVRLAWDDEPVASLGEQALRGVLAPTASNPLAGIENLRLSS